MVITTGNHMHKERVIWRENCGFHFWYIPCEKCNLPWEGRLVSTEGWLLSAGFNVFHCLLITERKQTAAQDYIFSLQTKRKTKALERKRDRCFNWQETERKNNRTEHEKWSGHFNHIRTFHGYTVWEIDKWHKDAADKRFKDKKLKKNRKHFIAISLKMNPTGDT